jgi:hypothetical protein
MSLLSFRAPVLYAACHRCGNALTHGEVECPHCGTSQSRALRTLGAPNSVDYGSNVVLMPGRMLVPYPSVPEELDTAMNIARERKRVLKRVAFYLASGGMLAMALGLAYAPALRSPVVQRLAALPEPATRQAVMAPLVPVASEDDADVATVASATVLAAASSTTVRDVTPAAQAVVSALVQPPFVQPPLVQPPLVQPTPQPTVAAPTIAPKVVASNQTGQPVAPSLVKQAATGKPAAVATTVTQPTVVASNKIAPTVVAAVPPEIDTHADKTAEATPPVSAMAMTMATGALAAAEAQARAFNDKVTNTYSKMVALAAAAIHPTPVSVPEETLLANKPNTRVAPSVANPAPVTRKPIAVAKAAAPAISTNTTPTPAITHAPEIASTKTKTPVITAAAALARLAPPVPSPTATADVPIASHAPEPSALTENGLPRMSMAPISPAMTAERPPAGSPGETLYIARLALLTNDLSAAHKNLAEVPSSLADDVEAKRIREELAQRESARDTAMQRARVCDAASSWRCARRYAKEATAIDASYPDSRVLLKRVNFKAAQAKKAADAAALQAANTTAHPSVRIAPIREAVAVSAVPRVATTSAAQQNIYVAPPAPSMQSNGNSAPHLFATPAVRPTRESHESHESHVIREARETRPIVETRETVFVPAPAKSPEPAESDSRVFGGGVPIRPPGRGDAH